MTLTLNAEQFADLLVEHSKLLIAGPKIGGRFAAIESRLAVLEPSTPAATGGKKRAGFVGPWEPRRAYNIDEAIALDRKLWVAVRSTSQQPGAGEDWQLVHDYAQQGGA